MSAAHGDTEVGGRTYAQWMREVDSAVNAKTASAGVGLSVHDLPDFNSRAMFESGESPEEAAAQVLEDEGWDSDWEEE